MRTVLGDVTRPASSRWHSASLDCRVWWSVAVGSEKMSRRTATMLSARSLVKSVADDLQTMASLCERVVAPSEWVHSALVANAVPAQKVIVSRQAVARSFVDQGLDRQRKSPGRELRIGFVGRLQPYKGVHILLEAMAQIPGDVPIRLSIAGSSTELPYLRRLQAAAAKDKRIEFLGATSHHQLPGFLEQIDILAVPSNYMETGPLVVLEAYAFGVPVMGADLGGIAERIRDGVDGWLLPSTTVEHGLQRCRMSPSIGISCCNLRQTSVQVERWPTPRCKWRRSIGDSRCKGGEHGVRRNRS